MVFGFGKVKKLQDKIDKLERQNRLLEITNSNLSEKNKSLEKTQMYEPYLIIDSHIHQAKTDSDRLFRNSEYDRAQKKLGEYNGLKKAKQIFEQYIKDEW